jgi:hypothetical protein
VDCALQARANGEAPRDRPRKRHQPVDPPNIRSQFGHMRPICRGATFRERQFLNEVPRRFSFIIITQEFDAMAVRSATKGILKAPDQPDNADGRDEAEAPRPRNAPPNTFPTEGFSIEVDGKLKSQHPTAEAAEKIGAELKRKFPVLQIMIYDAVGRTRTLIEATKEAAK